MGLNVGAIIRVAYIVLKSASASTKLESSPYHHQSGCRPIGIIESMPMVATSSSCSLIVAICMKIKGRWATWKLRSSGERRRRDYLTSLRSKMVVARKNSMKEKEQLSEV